jgi:C-terminal processing protease CtpA/Prc
MFNFCEPSVCCPTIKRQDGGLSDDKMDLRNEDLKPCGVGIGLRYDSDRQSIAVGSLAPGGPAYLSEKIQKDDILLRIDGKDVRSSKPSQLGPYLTGPKGSIVKLDLVRYVDGAEHPFSVALVRNWSMPPGSSRVSSRLILILGSFTNELF